jgi:sulfite reductase beta subunit-like hemoprotein
VGELPAIAFSSQVAHAAPEWIGTGQLIQISGCPKGCAHRGRAALAAIGRAGQCDLLVDGAPAGSVAVDAMPHDIARLARQRGISHG